MKYYVVSDVHGYYTELRSALERAGFFDDTEENRLIVCGDAFDRGEQARELQEFLTELLEQNRLIYILGNHEDLLVKCMQEISRGNVFEIACGMSHHNPNGTWDTLLQLGEMSEKEAVLNPAELLRRVMRTPFYQKLLSAGVDFHESENYIFCHGWIPTRAQHDADGVRYSYDENWRDAEIDAWQRARWLNGMDVACSHGVKECGKTIVCGHWHASYGHSKIDKTCSEWGNDADFSPFYSDGIIAIDACTAYSKTVNCIVIEDGEHKEKDKKQRIKRKVLEMIGMREKLMIKEFYETTAPMLPFEKSGDSEKVQRRIFEFIAKIEDCEDAVRECWSAIENASDIQTVIDIELISSPLEKDENYSDAVCNMREEYVLKNQIRTVSTFDLDLALMAAEDSARQGEAEALKLLACVNWLGLGKEKDFELATEIWKTLAISGDGFSAKALAHAYGELGNKQEGEKWKSIFELCDRAKSSFSPFVTCSGNETTDVAETAELIMCVRGLWDRQREPFLNLPMLHYLLHGADSVERKLETISQNQNYYLLHFAENKYGNKQFGF